VQGGDFLNEFEPGAAESRDGNEASGGYLCVANSVGEDFYVDCGVGDYGGGNGAGDVVTIDAWGATGVGGYCYLTAVDGPEQPAPVQDF